MHAFAEEAQSWDYENLNSFISNPKGVVPGTKMAFAGLKDDAERANVIAYLRTLAESPAPLPDAEAEAAAEAEAPGAGAPAPETEDGAGAEETSAAAGGEAASQSATAGGAAQEGSGTAGETSAQPQGSLGAVDSVPPDQAGTVPHVPPAEQPAPEGGAAAQAEGPAGQPEQAVAQGQAGEQATTVPAAGEQGGAAAAAATGGDPAKGEAFAKRCGACHTFEQDGGNKVGPPLFGVVNRPIASVPDFAYSDAMVAFSENRTKPWDVETLHGFLADPRGVVPGTKMIFPGVKNEADLANVIAYLQSLSGGAAPAAQ
jgi:cytochrome c2